MKQRLKPILGVLTLLLCLPLASCGTDDKAPESASPEILAPERADMLANTKWNASSDDSQLHFLDDDTFFFYRYRDDYSDSYYEGTYSFYIGQEALTYLTEDLADYGVTLEEWMDTISRNEQYTLENTVCLVIYNTACIVNGENTVTEPYTTPYMGFYLEASNYLDLANMNTAAYAGFTQVTDEP